MANYTLIFFWKKATSSGYLKNSNTVCRKNMSHNLFTISKMISPFYFMLTTVNWILNWFLWVTVVCLQTLYFKLMLKLYLNLTPQKLYLILEFLVREDPRCALSITVEKKVLEMFPPIIWFRVTTLPRRVCLQGEGCQTNKWTSIQDEVILYQKHQGESHVSKNCPTHENVSFTSTKK